MFPYDICVLCFLAHYGDQSRVPVRVMEGLGSGGCVLSGADVWLCCLPGPLQHTLLQNAVTWGCCGDRRDHGLVVCPASCHLLLLHHHWQHSPVTDGP